MADFVASGVYFGLDITEKYALISYYKQNMEEPETISTVVGSEMFQIPLYLSKRHGVGQWYIGNEARRQVQLNAAEGVDHLLKRALHRENIWVDTQEYQALDLFIIYLRKILTLPGQYCGNSRLEKLVITVPNLDMEYMEFLAVVCNRLGLDSSKVLFIDRGESFYYYSLNQRADVFYNDVMLFDIEDNQLTGCKLHRNEDTTPQLIKLEPANYGPLIDNKDMNFLKVLESSFEGNQISSVFLTGDGFDGDWMKASLAFLCHNRRVFAGKNLYSKGACYAGFVKDGNKPWPFVFMGDQELKVNLSLKVLKQNEMQFISLLDAGDNWFESEFSCEVILDGTKEIEFWIQRPEKRQATVEVLELNDLPDRENRTTRLRITAKPISDKDIKIIIRDLGFGDIVPSSNKVWEHELSIVVQE
ncbi:MAG: hypothetical protein K6F30_06940 [Lachnospiraceae bacterium]|nr:hypothetical protein [Lachnospiraceae bacterium]